MTSLKSKINAILEKGVPQEYQRLLDVMFVCFVQSEHWQKMEEGEKVWTLRMVQLLRGGFDE